MKSACAASIVTFLVLTGACITPPASPSDTDQPSVTVPVYVYVLQYGSTATPLPDVTVRVDDRIAGRTDSEGLAVVQVVPRIPVTIRVERNGYLGFGAEGTVEGSSETWRFWLEPAS